MTEADIKEWDFRKLDIQKLTIVGSMMEGRFAALLLDSNSLTFTHVLVILKANLMLDTGVPEVRVWVILTSVYLRRKFAGLSRDYYDTISEKWR